MNQLVHIFQDRSKREELPDAIGNFMSEHELISSRDDRVSFCGMLTNENDYYLFVPRHINVDKTPEKKLHLAILMMKTVEQYSRSHTTGIYDQTSERGEVNLGVLSLAKELLEDYIFNGLYIHKSTKNHHSSGRINWKKTITKSQPYEGKDGVPVYVDLSTHLTRFQKNSAVALIQAEIIRELDTRFSWWVTGKMGIKMSSELLELPVLQCNVEEKKQLLRRELQSLYSDREIRLLSNLLTYLETTRGILDGEIVTGIKKFHYVWEEMLRKILPHVSNLNSQLPVPSYVNSVGKSELSRGMVTDTIITKGNVTIVVDAKYYHARTASSAPGWSDLVKQFFYAKAVKCIRPNQVVKNLFIFPGKENENMSGPIKKVEMVLPNKGAIFDEVFTPIECLYIPPTIVMELYSKNQKIESIEPLFELSL